MASTAPKDEMTRVKVALVINLMATLVSFLVLLNIIDTHVTWRIVFCAIGFIGIASLTMMVYSRLIRLQKAEKQQVSRSK